MRTNLEGQQIIRDSESLQLEAYPDPGSALYRACKRARISPYGGGYRNLRGWENISGGPWTIGYGDTGPDVVPGLIIGAEEAEERLERRLADEFEPGVEQMLAVEVTGNQFSALVSFAYNCGLDLDRDGVAEGLGESTLIRKLNRGDIEGAAAEFRRWTSSGGKVLPGLVTRREQERQLFLTPGDGEAA